MKKILMLSILCIGNLFTASFANAQAFADTSYTLDQKDSTLYRHTRVGENAANYTTDDTLLVKNCFPELLKEDAILLGEHRVSEITKNKRTITSTELFTKHYTDTLYQYSLDKNGLDKITVKKEIAQPPTSGIKPHWIPIILITLGLLALVLALIYGTRKKIEKRKKNKEPESFSGDSK